MADLETAVVDLLAELVGVGGSPRPNWSPIATAGGWPSPVPPRAWRRLGAELGTGATFDAPYWMEAPLRQQVCPTLVCGPAGGGLHAVDEWVDLRQVRAFATALVAVLEDWSPLAD